MLRSLVLGAVVAGLHAPATALDSGLGLSPSVLRSFVLGALAVSSYVPATALNNGLGRTPVMGWNR